MFKKNLSIQEVKVFGSAILPAVALFFVNILSPVLQSIVHNSPSEHSHLMVPVLAQGTGYLVAPPAKRHQ